MEVPGAVGFIGAFSTFSTYEWETLSSIKDGAFRTGGVVRCWKFGLGLMAVWMGSMAANSLR